VAGRVTNWLGIKENQKMAGRVVSSKATKFYTYSRTARSNTEYATKMKRLSNQIFGEVRRPMNASQAALVDKFASEPLEQSEMWVTWYPGLEETAELMRNLREYGLFRDEHQDFKDEMARLRQLRGKVKMRQSWVDGKPPVKIVVPKYDGLNSYQPDPSHI